MKKDHSCVAVVGGGIAGLTAAYQLKQSGCDVTVFEADPRLGGRMVSEVRQQITFDQGADFLSENYCTLKFLAKELQIPWKPRVGEVVNRIVRDEVAHEYRLAGLSAVLKLPMLRPAARFALMRWLVRLHFKRQECDFFHLSTTDHQLDGISAHDYLEQYVHPEVAIYVADGFTSSMQFHRATDISAGALEAFMHMMMKPNQQFMVRYTPPRIDRIPQALAAVITHTLEAAASQILLRNDQVEVTAGRTQAFDGVVVATPAYATRTMLGEVSPTLHAVLDGTRYAKTIVLAYTDTSGSLPRDVHMTYVPYLENQWIGGYTNESCKPGVTPDGVSLLNVYLHEEGAEQLWHATDGQVSDRILQELPKVLPEIRGKTDVLSLHGIQRWERAMPVFSGNHIARVRAYEQSLNPNERIVLAGDYLNAPWTEGAARSGWRAARQLASLLGTTVPPVPHQNE